MRLVTDMVEFCAERCRAGIRSRSRATTSARRARRRRRSWRSRWRTGSTYVEWARRAGSRRRRVRAAAVVLLQRAYRLLRGDREVPGGAADLGAGAARHVRRADERVVADAVPHADGRRVADRAAAAQQHRADGDRGAGGGARRDAVAAHQLLRRGAGAADRGGGEGRVADAADHRRRDGRGEHDRPAGRLVLRRGADRSSWRGRRTSTSTEIDELGGMVEARRAAASPSARSPMPRSATSTRSRPGSGGRRRQPLHRWSDDSEIPILQIDPALEAKQIARVQALREGRDNAALKRRSRALAGGAASRREPDAAADHRGRPCRRDEGEMCDALRDVWGDLARDSRRLSDDAAPMTPPHGRQDPRRRREARPRRPRPRREDHRARAARRRHGGHLHRACTRRPSRSSRP